MDIWLSDQERGGFYASQDADYSLDDDGDYFTWTRDEAAAVLTPEELALASAYFDIGEVGDMHHNPAKNVLHITEPLERAVLKAKIAPESAAAVLAEAKRKLYRARLARPAPYIDKTLYTAWNAMCVSAYLEAGRVLELPAVFAFALKSLDRVLDAAMLADGGVQHVVGYGETGGTAARVAGVLEDYAFLGSAALDAWEATGEGRYYRAAEAIAGEMLLRFHDPVGGGFFDTENPAEGETRLGALGTRRKPLQDSPTPAGNPMAAALLLRLESLNGKVDYLVAAQETLEMFAGIVEHFGLYAATYGLALQRIAQRPVQVCILGEGLEARRMEAIAMARFAVNKSVIRLDRSRLGELPPSLAETLPHLPGLDSADAVAVVCSGNGCQPPVNTADALLAMLNEVL